jgi:hypothetical protein
MAPHLNFCELKIQDNKEFNKPYNYNQSQEQQQDQDQQQQQLQLFQQDQIQINFDAPNYYTFSSFDLSPQTSGDTSSNLIDTNSDTNTSSSFSLAPSSFFDMNLAENFSTSYPNHNYSATTTIITDSRPTQHGNTDPRQILNCLSPQANRQFQTNCTIVKTEPVCDIDDDAYETNKRPKRSTPKASNKSVNELRYGPLVVRPRRNPAPTLASGRKSKYISLTPEEEYKRDLRRIRNRQAAEKCKLKRLEVEDCLNANLNKLKESSVILHNELDNLKAEKQMLELLLDQHICSLKLNSNGYIKNEFLVQPEQQVDQPTHQYLFDRTYHQHLQAHQQQPNTPYSNARYSQQFNSLHVASHSILN